MVFISRNNIREVKPPPSMEETPHQFKTIKEDKIGQFNTVILRQPVKHKETLETHKIVQTSKMPKILRWVIHKISQLWKAISSLFYSKPPQQPVIELPKVVEKEISKPPELVKAEIPKPEERLEEIEIPKPEEILEEAEIPLPPELGGIEPESPEKIPLEVKGEVPAHEEAKPVISPLEPILEPIQAVPASIKPLILGEPFPKAMIPEKCNMEDKYFEVGEVIVVIRSTGECQYGLYQGTDLAKLALNEKYFDLGDGVKIGKNVRALLKLNNPIVLGKPIDKTPQNIDHENKTFLFNEIVLVKNPKGENYHYAIYRGMDENGKVILDHGDGEKYLIGLAEVSKSPPIAPEKVFLGQHLSEEEALKKIKADDNNFALDEVILVKRSGGDYQYALYKGWEPPYRKFDAGDGSPKAKKGQFFFKLKNPVEVEKPLKPVVVNLDAHVPANQVHLIGDKVFKKDVKLDEVYIVKDKGEKEYKYELIDRRDSIKKAAEIYKINHPIAMHIVTDPFIELSLQDEVYLEADAERSHAMQQYLYNFPNFNKEDKTLAGYAPLTGNIQNFSSKPIASVGSTSTREVVLLDPAHSPKINSCYADLKEILLEMEKENGAPLDEEEILKAVMRFVRKDVFPSCTSPSLIRELETFVNSQRSGEGVMVKGKKVPFIPIDKFIERGVGVCRHHGMVTCYFLDKLTKEKSIHGKPFLSGIVQHMRDNIPQGAHVWVTYVFKGKRMHVDTLWNELHDFSNPENFSRLKRYYGDETMERQMKRTNKAYEIVQTR